MSDHANSTERGYKFWRDKLFWTALLLAPLCWLVMMLMGLTSDNRSIPWRALLWIGLIYPVLEEIVFRGGLQSALLNLPLFKKSQVGLTLANVVTSIIFAAFHLINQPALWAALVFFPSLVFGWARDRYQTVAAAIILHVFYNMGFVLLFSR